MSFPHFLSAHIQIPEGRLLFQPVVGLCVQGRGGSDVRLPVIEPLTPSKARVGEVGEKLASLFLLT